MLKKRHQERKRARFLALMGSFVALACLVIYVLSPYISIYMVLNLFPFLPSTTNSTPTFYGENIDMSQILPTSQHYIVNKKGEDLIDIAATLGVNLIRITNGEPGFNNNADSIYTGQQWNQVLNKMQRKGMKAIILIETASNNPDYYTPNIQSVYLHLVQAYIASGVFANPDVYAVDIKNEPILTDANIKVLQTAHAMLKAAYPDLKQTIGWWATTKSLADPYNPNNYNWSDFSAGQKIDSLVDFYSIHMYGLDTNHFGINLNADVSTKVFISQVENGLQTKKPILIGEFGEANGDAVSDQDTIGDPQLQANIYQGVYQGLKEMHSSKILGSVAFDLYSRNQYPDAWAIVKDKGNYLFPAAYILQAYALGKKNTALQDTNKVYSQSYLVRNVDNHTTQNLHIADRIGLKLQFEDNKTYSASLDAQNIVQPVELFHYDPTSSSYYALYQARSKGSLQLTNTPNCSAKVPCSEVVYALTITIT